MVLAFLLYQLWQIPSYGASWDEPLHRLWAQHLLEGNHDLPGNGIYYGPLYYMLEEYLVRILVPRGFEVIHAMHVLHILTATIGIALTFLLARRLFGSAVAWIALLFLILFPPLLAHAHYNPKDIPLFTAFVATLFFVDRARERASPGAWAIAGAMQGISVSLKPSAILLVPIIGLALLAAGLLERGKRKVPQRTIATCLIAFCIAGAVALLATWPTAWEDPLLPARSLLFFANGNFWTQSVLYLGNIFPAAELPWHYIPVMFFLATPIVTIVCALGGVVVALHSLIHRKHVWPFAVLLCWFFLPFLLSMKTGIARYDGFRQYLFLVPAVAIFAGVGLEKIVGSRWHWAAMIPSSTMPHPRREAAEIYNPDASPPRVRGKGSMSEGIIAFFIAIIIIVQIKEIHPYEGSYVNEVGRVLLPRPLEKTIELDYWGTSYREAVDWLNAHARANATICTPLARHLVLLYPRRSDLTFECNGRYDYLLLLTRYGMIPIKDRVLPEPIVFRVTRYNSDLVRLYDSSPPP